MVIIERHCSPTFYAVCLNVLGVILKINFNVLC